MRRQLFLAFSAGIAVAALVAMRPVERFKAGEH